jgi:hypothetical protein
LLFPFRPTASAEFIPPPTGFSLSFHCQPVFHLAGFWSTIYGRRLSPVALLWRDGQSRAPEIALLIIFGFAFLIFNFAHAQTH